MARITAFSLKGINCWFPSNDHDPPHFHAKRNGKWEVRVFFLNAEPEMLELVWKKSRASKSDRGDLIRLAREHRQLLLAQWESIRQ